LIIGGTRFIGPYVARELIKMGHDICLFHRGTMETGLCGKVECIHADRSDILDYAQPLKEFAPDVVLDMIPLGQRDAIDTMRLFQGVAGRLVGISSQDVYRAYGVLTGIEAGPPDLVPLSEDAPLRSTLFPYRAQVAPGHRLYSYDKIPVEEAYMGNPDLPGTILRLPMVYGPGDYQHRTFPYLKRMDDRRPAIILEGKMAGWRWTKGYVEDIARAIVLAATDGRAAGRIYNLGEEESPSEAEWVRAVGGAAGWDGDIIVLPDEKLPEYLKTSINTDQQLVVDTGRIRAELGYTESVSRAEALQRTIAWERLNPPGEIDPKQFDYQAEDALLEN
jgi:nucleoside-diphosphate-sugar epimerase